MGLTYPISDASKIPDSDIYETIQGDEGKITYIKDMDLLQLRQMEEGRKCRWITFYCNPEKFTTKEFCDTIRESIDSFEQNMENLNQKPKYGEDWISLYGAWLEMEHGDWT